MNTSLLPGIGAMILLGLTWIIYGIVMGRAPKEKIPIDLLLWLSAISACVLSIFIGFAWCPPAGSSRIWFEVFAVLFVCGICNFFQLKLMALAMQLGPNGIIWSIVQSGFIFPFATGILFFDTIQTPWCLTGFFMITGSVFLLGINKNKGKFHGYGKRLTIAAFFASGVTQTLSNLPSFFPEAEVVNSVWRSVFFYSGLALPGTVLLFHSSQRIHFASEWHNAFRSTRLWSYCGAMVFLELAGSYFLLYPGMNILASHGAGGIAYPLMVGACIIGFECYSSLFLHERRTRLQWVAFWAGLIGIFLMAGLL